MPLQGGFKALEAKLAEKPSAKIGRAVNLAKAGVLRRKAMAANVGTAGHLKKGY